MSYLIDNKVLIAELAVSGAVVSEAFGCERNYNASIQPIWVAGSGTPEGTFDVQVSTDGAHFTALTLSSTPTLTGDEGNLIITLDSLPFKFLRVAYTPTQGVVDLSVNLTSKRLR